MKNKSKILTALILLLSLNANGQIKQDCNGNVGIGGYLPSSLFDLNCYSARFNNLGIGTDPSSYILKTTGDLLFENGYVSLKYSCTYSPFEAELYPLNNNLISLGLPNKAFSKVYSYEFVDLSDKEQKENIQGIENALEKILKLNGVKYDIKKEFAYNDSVLYNEKSRQKLENNRKNKLGFLAQDVEKVIPEIVFKDDSTDVYAMSYTRIIPVLVEAFKEQNLIIESLQEEIQELKNNTGIGSKLKSGTVSDYSTEIQDDNLLTSNALYQNSPNPFSRSTTIEYLLNDNVQEAMICIYDMNGTQLKCIPLHLSGFGNITINGSELKAGMYMYSLITDDKLIDTKRMVLTN
jgi:hypothetical protein